MFVRLRRARISQTCAVATARVCDIVRFCGQGITNMCGINRAFLWDLGPSILQSHNVTNARGHDGTCLWDSGLGVSQSYNLTNMNGHSEACLWDLGHRVLQSHPWPLIIGDWIDYWFLSIGYSSMIIDYWLLNTDDWLLMTTYRQRGADYSLLTID